MRQAKTDSKSEHIFIDGVQGRLHVDDGGAGGLPVVFVHSAAGSTAHWEAQLDHLRPSRRALAIDLRGHGQSAPPRDGDYRIASMADDLRAALDHLGLPRVVLVGHSMGGLVCAAFAGAHPERVAGLFLLDPASDGRQIPQAVAASMMASLRSDAHAATEAYWASMLAPSPGAVRARLIRDLRATPPATIIGPLEDMLTFDPITPLSRYAGPKMAVITDANETPAALHAQVPGIPVRKVPTGHWVQLDDPQGVNRLLDEFLNGLPSGEAR
ncbi:MAG TPA: alpha/beta hydrolase [Polyangia bacterium]